MLVVDKDVGTAAAETSLAVKQVLRLIDTR